MYYVDVPNPHDLSGPWINVGMFSDEKTAKDFVRNHITGCDQSTDVFLTFIDDDIKEDHRIEYSKFVDDGSVC